MPPDELVLAAYNGDRAARDEIGSWMLGQIWQFFARNYGSPERVFELCQTTLTEFWAKLPQQGPSTAAEFLVMLRRFAVVAARRATSDAAREIDRQTKLDLLREPTPTRSPATKLAQRRAVLAAERCLMQLATPLRNTVRWRLEGGTLRQYARANGIPEGTVRSDYHRGIHRLRELLAREGLTPSQCGL